MRQTRAARWINQFKKIFFFYNSPYYKVSVKSGPPFVGDVHTEGQTLVISQCRYDYLKSIVFQWIWWVTQVSGCLEDGRQCVSRWWWGGGQRGWWLMLLRLSWDEDYLSPEHTWWRTDELWMSVCVGKGCTKAILIMLLLTLVGH